MVVNIKDFFKNNPDFIRNSVLIKNRSDENTIVMLCAEWSSPLDNVINYYGDDLNKRRIVKKGIVDYYYHNPKLHYYIVYRNNSTIEEQELINEIYDSLIGAEADVILLEEIDWAWDQMYRG